jgi:hypothetical protein
LFYFLELQKPESWRLACQTIVGNKENSGKVILICASIYLVLVSLYFCADKSYWNLSLTILLSDGSDVNIIMPLTFFSFLWFVSEFWHSPWHFFLFYKHFFYLQENIKVQLLKAWYCPKIQRLKKNWASMLCFICL